MQLFMFGFVDTLHGCEGVFLFPAFSVISLHSYKINTEAADKPDREESAHVRSNK